MIIPFDCAAVKLTSPYGERVFKRARKISTAGMIWWESGHGT